MQSPLKEGLKCKTLSFSELFIPYKKKGIILQEFSKITMIINIAWRKLYKYDYTRLFDRIAGVNSSN